MKKKRIIEDMPIGEDHIQDGKSATYAEKPESDIKFGPIKEEFIPEEELTGVPEGDIRSKQPSPEDDVYSEIAFDVNRLRTVKQRSQVIEKAIGQVAAGGLVILTVKIFGINNRMLKEEAESITEPCGRMFGRHFGKQFNALLPLGKIRNQQDRADVEEIVVTFGLFVLRIIMGMWQRFQWEQEMKKFQRNDPEGYSRYMSMNRDQQVNYMQAKHAEDQARSTHQDNVVHRNTANAANTAKVQYNAAMESVGNTDSERRGSTLGDGKVLINVPDGLEEGYEVVDPLDRILGS